MYRLQVFGYGRWIENYSAFEATSLEVARTVLTRQQAKYPREKFRLIFYEVVGDPPDGTFFVEYDHSLDISRGRWAPDGTFQHLFPEGCTYEQARTFIRDERWKWNWPDDSFYRIVNAEGEVVK